MSFSTETKRELTRVNCEGRDNECAELSSIFKTAGSIQIVGLKKINLRVVTEQNSIARKVFKLLKDNFSIITSITVNKNQQLKRNNSYVLTITNDMGCKEMMKELGLIEPSEGFFTYNRVPKKFLLDDKLKAAFIRGAFLGGGSISDPRKSYHMEFVTNSEEFAMSLKNLINTFDLNSKIVSRKNNFIVYLKESEQISDLLSIIGAHSSLLTLQNAKILKEMRNNVNRIVNCETANLSKTVNASVRQVEDIDLIQNTIGIRKLPLNLQDVAIIRIENEDMSLKEIGEILDPPISKSGVNHRFKKIKEIAEKIRNENDKL